MTHTILIVDDSAIIRRLLRSSIEQTTDWQVSGEAENGEIAVERFKELRPDVVILDFQMPVMNGIEAARRISNIAPNTHMIMFTMHHGEQLSRNARAAGISEVLSKSEGGSRQLQNWLRSAQLASET